MKIAAVICEYNPFHNGHKYQIQEIKKEYDAVVAIMSGSFVQRGELAVFDKWTRAKTALINGVDLVIELPVCYALNTAERFAFGGVQTAISTGVADALVFGSESGNIKALISSAKTLNDEPEEVSKKIKAYMEQGLSYPSAREKAYAGLIPESLLLEPNNILALEYIKELLKNNADIQPVTIKRIGARYNETEFSGELNSASGIRKRLEKGEDISVYIPDNTLEILKKSQKYDTEKLFPYIKYAVISREDVSKINDVREGLENRIISAVKTAKNYNEMLNLIKTKRYTMSSIKRILLAILLKQSKNTAQNKPEYLRILGMNSMGKNILKKMKKKNNLPIVIKTADFSSPMLDLDILATDIASLAVGEELGRDYKISPVII